MVQSLNKKIFSGALIFQHQAMAYAGQISGEGKDLPVGVGEFSKFSKQIVLYMFFLKFEHQIKPLQKLSLK